MDLKRHYNRWTVNEVLKLQREYELLGLPVKEIAELHNRSEFAIICRIEQEGFISNQSNSVNMVTTLNSISNDKLTMTTRSKVDHVFVPVVKQMVKQFIDKRKRRALKPLRSNAKMYNNACSSCT